MLPTAAADDLDSGDGRRASMLRELTHNLLRTYSAVSPAFSYDPALNPRRVLTRPEVPVYNNGFDNANHDFIVRVDDVILGHDRTEYRVVDLLGGGTFGQVFKCTCAGAPGQQDVVAVKVIKSQPAFVRQAWMEIYVLGALHRSFPPEQVRHVVRLLGHFTFRRHLCLVFERLSISLYELVKQNHFRGLSLDVVRSLLAQVLAALSVLRRMGVIHCDLKPENILLKRPDSSEVKLIDFGSACQTTHATHSYVQSRFYRSPEVLLGVPYTTAVDMWSLGCIAGELFLGLPLFPGHDDDNMLRRMAEMLAPNHAPPQWMLQRGRHAARIFRNDQLLGGDSDSGREAPPGQRRPAWKRYFQYAALEDIVMNYPLRRRDANAAEVAREMALRRAFVDLLQGMLRVDPNERLTPDECLRHPFVLGEGMPHGAAPWRPPRMREATASAEDDVPQQQPASSSAPNLQRALEAAQQQASNAGDAGNADRVAEAHGEPQRARLLAIRTPSSTPTLTLPAKDGDAAMDGGECGCDDDAARASEKFP